VQLGDHPGVLLTEGSTSVDQDRQDGELFVVDHRPESGHPGADQGDRVRVGGVGLAALPGREHPGARGQLGCLPMPAQPSMAQTRSRHRLR
jgi:hypothetical protein